MQAIADRNDDSRYRHGFVLGDLRRYIHTVVNGTATDGAGGFWRFNYADNMRPIGGGAYEVTDHFNLVGSGSPIKLHSHFVVDFTSSDLESAGVLVIEQPGNCETSASPDAWVRRSLRGWVGPSSQLWPMLGACSGSPPSRA